MPEKVLKRVTTRTEEFLSADALDGDIDNDELGDDDDDPEDEEAAVEPKTAKSRGPRSKR